jgi:hypothetical protein
MGRFLIGFVIGLIVGAAAIILTGQRGSQPEGIGKLVAGASDAARRASDRKQQAMWSDYRTRVQQASQPKPNTDKPWEPYER